VPKARARNAYVEEGITEVKQILDEPGPQVPQELMDEVDFGGDISSEESFEILEFLHDLKQHWEQKTKRSTKTRPRLPAATGLAVPPPYAAGIPRVQPPPA